MDLYEKIKRNMEKIAVIGLGYVGMPLAVAFSKKVDTIGFDVDDELIKMYQNGIDPTNEVGDEVIQNCNVLFTNDETKLAAVRLFIIAVPTPISKDLQPDMTYCNC